MSATRALASLAPMLRCECAFFETSPSPMAVVREDGIVLLANEAAQKLFCNQPTSTPPDFDLRAWGPPGFALDRIAFMQQLADSGRDGISRDLWKGEQFLTHFRRLRNLPPDEPLARFITIHERAHGPRDQSHFPDQIFHEPAVQDLGPLAHLSPREFEVLALIGEGLTAPQIGARLFRTTDTISAHTARLLEKLQCANRSQLAIHAYRAGLKLHASATTPD